MPPPNRPNIAAYVTRELWPASRLTNLKGIAVGNGCWGGTEDSVACNGPNEDRNDVDLFFGKGLLSRKTRDSIYKTCGYEAGSNADSDSLRCRAAVAKMDTEVGPHNVYNVYDNCELTTDFLQRTGKTATWLRSYLRDAMNTHGTDLASTHAELKDMNGGFDWACGGMAAIVKYFKRDDVLKALHLPQPNLSKFKYKTSGPASVTLYPELVKQIRTPDRPQHYFWHTRIWLVYDFVPQNLEAELRQFYLRYAIITG